MTDLITALPVLLTLCLGIVSSFGESRTSPFIVTVTNSSSLDCLLENIFNIRKHQKIYSEGLRFTGFNRRVLFPKYKKLNSRDGKFIQMPFKSHSFGTGPVSLINKLSQFRHTRTSDRTTVETETSIIDLSLTAATKSINTTATSVTSGQFLTYLLTSSLKQTISLSQAAAVSSSVRIGDEQSGFTSHHRVSHFKESAFNTSSVGDPIMYRFAKSDVHHHNFTNMRVSRKPCCSSFRHNVSYTPGSWLFSSSRNILRFSRKPDIIHFQSKTKNPKPHQKLIIQGRQPTLRPAEVKVRLTPTSNLANVIINITDLSSSQDSKQRYNSVLKSALFNNTSDYICKSYVDISLSPTDCSMHHFIRSYFRLKETITSDLKQDLLLENDVLIHPSAKRADDVDINFNESKKDVSESPSEHSILTQDLVTPKLQRSNQHTSTSRRTVKRSGLRPFSRKSTMQEYGPNGILPPSSYRNTYDSSLSSLSSTKPALPQNVSLKVIVHMRMNRGYERVLENAIIAGIRLFRKLTGLLAPSGKMVILKEEKPRDILRAFCDDILESNTTAVFHLVNPFLHIRSWSSAQYVSNLLSTLDMPIITWGPEYIGTTDKVSTGADVMFITECGVPVAGLASH